MLPSRDITRKLTQRHVKCRVLERVGRLAYRLQLPPELAGAHPVVSVQHLERAPPEGDMTSAEPPSTYDSRFPDDTDRADVDAVLDMRYRGRGRGRRKQYLVRWSALGNEHLEWLDEDNLVGAEEKVLEYLQNVLQFLNRIHLNCSAYKPKKAPCLPPYLFFRMSLFFIFLSLPHLMHSTSNHHFLSL